MSRYAVDKVLRQLILHEAEQERFRADPARFLVGYDLAAEERAALIAQDYGTLYALGAHPFLLWGWVGRAPEKEREVLRERYCAAVSPHGYPDYTT